MQTRSYKEYDGTQRSEVVKINGKDIKWVMNTNDGGLYQERLDDALKGQPYNTNKVDMFLVETDYAQKYTQANAALSVQDIGITDNDTKNMYQFVKNIGTGDKPNSNELKALSWQTNVGLFYYDADIAKKVLGTSDPAKVQNYVKDWKSYKQTAQKMKAKGYKMSSSSYDSYHVFASNISAPWVKNNKLRIDSQMYAWVEQEKEFYSKGYTNKTDQWTAPWLKDMAVGSNVFGFFMPDWGLEYCLMDFSEYYGKTKPAGKWKACMGPAGWYWSGTLLCGAVDSDNKDIVADIMKTMTCNTNVAKQYIKDYNLMPNNKAAVAAVSKTYKNSYLGGQNHFALMSKNADRIKTKGRTSLYDQGCLEFFMGSMAEYIKGESTYRDSLNNFIHRFSEWAPDVDTGYGSSQIVQQ